MKKRDILIVVIIALTFVILFASNGLKLKVGSSEYHAQQEQVFSGNLINVTGVMLMTPDEDTMLARQREIEKGSHIDFRLYSFSSPELIQSFQRLGRTGVPIRGIMENLPYKQTDNEFKKLQEKFALRKSIELRSDEELGTNFQHAKTFITDKAWIMQTANLGYSAFFNNREFFFVSYDPTIRESLGALFEKDRNGEKIIPEDIHPNVLFCPIDCRYKIETLLSGAKQNIRMYQQYIQDENIMDMLVQRSGLDLKFIVADNDSKEELLASPLSQFAHFRKKPYVHAKMILIDDKYLLLSSINMSANSMDMNREIGVVIIDSFLIAQFKQQFERDWKK